MNMMFDILDIDSFYNKPVDNGASWEVTPFSDRLIYT